MSAQWTVASARDALKWYLNISSPTRPTTYWLGLSTTSADPAGSFTELTVANYARKQITWAYGGDVYAVNSNQIDFTNLGSGTVLGQGVFTAGTGGTLLFWADLTTAIGFGTGHTISYSPGLVRVGATI